MIPLYIVRDFSWPFCLCARVFFIFRFLSLFCSFVIFSSHSIDASLHPLLLFRFINHIWQTRCILVGFFGPRSIRFFVLFAVRLFHFSPLHSQGFIVLTVTIQMLIANYFTSCSAILHDIFFHFFNLGFSRRISLILLRFGQKPNHSHEKAPLQNRSHEYFLQSALYQNSCCRKPFESIHLKVPWRHQFEKPIKNISFIYSFDDLADDGNESLLFTIIPLKSYTASLHMTYV